MAQVSFYTMFPESRAAVGVLFFSCTQRQHNCVFLRTVLAQYLWKCSYTCRRICEKMSGLFTYAHPCILKKKCARRQSARPRLKDWRQIGYKVPAFALWFPCLFNLQVSLSFTVKGAALLKSSGIASSNSKSRGDFATQNAHVKMSPTLRYIFFLS